MKLMAMRDYILKLANNASRLVCLILFSGFLVYDLCHRSFASRPRTELELEKNLRTMGDVELQKLSVVPQTVFLKSKSSTSDLTPRSSRLQSYSRRPFDIPGRTPRMSRASSVDHGATSPALEDLKRRLVAINGSSSSLNLTTTARERQAVPLPAPVPPSTTQPATLALPAQSPGHDRPSSPTDSVVSATNSSTLRTVHKLQVGSTDSQKAAPAVGSSNTNAVGLLEAPSKMRSEGSPERSGRSSPNSMAGTARGNRPRTSMFPISTYGTSKAISVALCSWSVDGPEPGINNLLENIYSDSNRELQHDFGPKVHEGPVRRRNTTRQSFLTRDSGNRRTEATLIAHLQSHSDCVTGLAVSPDHAFFVSCSDDMSVKVWDTARLERSVTSKPRYTYTQHHARVKCVCMLEGVHCFASAAEDGSLHVVRVHVNQSGSLPKYGKLQTIREYRVGSPGEYVTCMVHYNSGRMLASRISTSLVKHYFIRCCLKPCLGDNALCHHYSGPADHAGLAAYAKPASFRTYHLYVSGPQTHMDSRRHFHGYIIALGPTLWFVAQELASWQDLGKIRESAPVRYPSHKRERDLGNGCRRELEGWFGVFAYNPHRSLGH